MLSAEKLDVKIGTASIIRAGTFVVRPGAVTGLLGRNGAGKTTLLRALMGLSNVTSGTLTLDGKDLRRVESSERARLGIGYMPEDRRLISGITVEENLLLPHWAMRIEEIDRRLEWVYLLIPECLPLRYRRASLLSGGQQKLVALARALVVGRRLLLLDEPTEGVAPQLAYRILEILKQLAQEQCTIFIAESDAVKLTSLVKHIYTVERGQITEVTYDR